MVKYAVVNKCGEECPHYDQDPQTVSSEFWGEHVCLFWCLYEQNMKWKKVFDEKKFKIIENHELCKDFPEWCPLDGPNDL